MKSGFGSRLNSLFDDHGSLGVRFPASWPIGDPGSATAVLVICGHSWSFARCPLCAKSGPSQLDLAILRWAGGGPDQHHPRGRTAFEGLGRVERSVGEGGGYKTDQTDVVKGAFATAVAAFAYISPIIFAWSLNEFNCAFINSV